MIGVIVGAGIGLLLIGVLDIHSRLGQAVVITSATFMGWLIA